jgi:dienelactone hydrolase
MRRGLIVVLSVMLLWAAPSARAAQPYVDPVYEVSVTHDIVYGQAPRRNGETQQLLLDLYEPVGDEQAAPRPVYVFAHGGSLVGGDKAEGSGNPVYYATEMARRGYLALSINYRLLDQFIDAPSFIGAINPELRDGLIDAQHDMQAAVRWVRANAASVRADADRIAVAGHSAGAGVALYVNYNAEDPGDSGNPGYPSRVSGAISYSGSLLEPTVIGPNEPPIKMFHAIDDTTAPYFFPWVNTCLPAMAMGDVCEFTTYSAGNHGLNGHKEENLGGTIAFLCRRVVTCA